MKYVVLVPAFAWVLMLASAWTMAAYLAWRRIGFQHPLMLALLFAMALQAVLASSMAIVTSVDPLSGHACSMGYYGIFATPAVSAVEGGVVIYLSAFWPRRASGVRRRFRTWTSLWLVFNLLALLAHMRSLGLCTL